jgi:hypothetical protein
MKHWNWFIVIYLLFYLFYFMYIVRKNTIVKLYISNKISIQKQPQKR